MRQHQQYVGRVQWVVFFRLPQAVGNVFEMVDAFVAEVAHQPAGKTGQAGDVGGFELGVVLFDDVQRVAVVRLHEPVVLIDFGAAARYFDVVAAGQPDKRIAPEAFAAHHRFQQIAERPVGECEIQRERGVQIGEQLLHEGDAVVALRGLGLVLGFGNHNGLSGNGGIGFQAAYYIKKCGRV